MKLLIYDYKFPPIKKLILFIIIFIYKVNAH